MAVRNSRIIKESISRLNQTGDRPVLLSELASLFDTTVPPGGESTEYLRGDVTWQTLDKTSVGLSNVDNTNDATKFTSPTFTGVPSAPTATNGTNTTQIATTAFVQAAVALLVNSAPSTLDTLKELSDALGDDANFATTVTNLIAAKLALSGGQMTGALNEAKGTNIASSTTPDIGGGTGNLIHITGTITITGFANATAGIRRMLIFDGILTFTHNATTLIIPGGANVTTAAGDCCIIVSEGSGNWRVLVYVKASGKTVTETATTQANGDNSTKIATTAYVDNALAKQSENIIIPISDETTALTAGTNKFRFRMPFAFTVTSVKASLNIAQSSGSIFTIDINEEGTSILSTKLTIDNTEKTSTTAATPAVISDASLASDAEIEFDIDQIGVGDAVGCKITLTGTRT